MVRTKHSFTRFQASLWCTAYMFYLIVTYKLANGYFLKVLIIYSYLFVVNYNIVIFFYLNLHFTRICKCVCVDQQIAELCPSDKY